MNLHEFIFAKGRYRFFRHLIFWMAWILFSATVQLTGYSPGPVSLSDVVLYQVLRSLTRLPSFILFCYVTIYVLVPIFITKKKYISFFLFFLLFVFVLYWLTYFFLTPFFHFMNNMVGGQFMQPTTPFILKFFAFYSNVNFSGAIPACCLMLAIKYCKDLYKKQSETEILKRENKVAELQLLKAQIHPHFLFNTLNNIYSFALTGSSQAEGLVNKLSGMIDYITTEGAKSLVPVEKEIQLIKDYIGLEKVRYGDRLDLQVEIYGDYENKFIAPLLLIPFVENCFKHGASVMRGQQWIKLKIEVTAKQLEFTLSNSKPAQPPAQKNKNGIGLMNVQKRLQLLYPEKHFLKATSSDETYSVHLQITLQDELVLNNRGEFKPKLQAAFL